MIAPAQVLGLLALLAAALLLPLGMIGLRERATQRGAAFAALMFSLTGWTMGVGLELLTLRTNLIFDTLMLVGMAAGPVLWLQFNLAYTEQGYWLTRWRLALLWSCAVLFALLALTNPLHNWIVQAAPPVVGVAMRQRIPAGLGQLYGVYTLALSVIGLVALLRYARRSARLRRAQATILCAAAIIPLLAGALHVFRIEPLAAVPLTAQSFLISALMLWFAVNRFHLMSVPPHVHRILFREHERCGVGARQMGQPGRGKPGGDGAVRHRRRRPGKALCQRHFLARTGWRRDVATPGDRAHRCGGQRMV
jgi:hypothetical protein